MPAQQSHWGEPRPRRRGKQVPGCQSRTRLEQERTGLNRRWADPSRLARARPRSARPAIPYGIRLAALAPAQRSLLGWGRGHGAPRFRFPRPSRWPVRSGSSHPDTFTVRARGNWGGGGEVTAPGNNGRGRADGGAPPLPPPPRCHCHVPSAHTGTGSGGTLAPGPPAPSQNGFQLKPWPGQRHLRRLLRATARGGRGLGRPAWGTFTGARRFQASPEPARAGSPHPSVPKPIKAWHRLSNRLTNPAPPIAARPRRALSYQASLRAPSLKSLKLFQPGELVHA